MVPTLPPKAFIKVPPGYWGRARARFGQSTLIDLRVDWSEENPISGLRALWHGWAPQMHDYVTRALEPSRAPTFAVPGDP